MSFIVQSISTSCFLLNAVSVTSSTRKFLLYIYIKSEERFAEQKTQEFKSKDEENGTRRGMFETRIRGIAKTTWKEAKVRGGCLLPQLSPPRSLSLCLSLSPQIGLTPISFFTILSLSLFVFNSNPYYSMAVLFCYMPSRNCFKDSVHGSRVLARRVGAFWKGCMFSFWYFWERIFEELHFAS